MLRSLNRIETLLYALALLLALSVRLLNLGSTPLSDAEATWALQAARVGRAIPAGYDFSLGPQPAYTTLTGLAFAVTSAGTTLARFWPALLGALLALAPLAFRRQLGRVGALGLAFGIAIDPGLVTVSRQAGGPMLALAFSLLAVALFQARHRGLAGIAAGLALVSGPALLAGILAVGLAAVLARLLHIPLPLGEPATEPATAAAYPLPDIEDPSSADPEWEAELEPEEFPLQPQASTQEARPVISTPDLANLRMPLVAMGITALLAGSAFWLAPQGLGAWLGMLPAYFSGWANPSGVPAGRLLAALVFYQPMALAFAIAGVVRGVREWNASSYFQEDGLFAAPGRHVLFFGLWAVIALVLALLRPGRQVSDLVWTLIPVWVLAAAELSHYLPEKNLWPVAPLQALVVFVLTGLAWYSLASTIPLLFEQGTELLRYTLTAGIVLLIALTTVLVTLGWSWRAASHGFVWGLTAAGVIYLVAWMWGAAQARFNAPQELWGAPPSISDSDLMVKTLTQLSTWSLGNSNYIDIVVTVDSPALRWLLRDFKRVTYGVAPAATTTPAVVINWQDPEHTPPAVNAAYRGEPFNWEALPGWTGSLPADKLRWFLYREAPLQYKQVILWARGDLFPGGSEQPLEANPPIP